MKIFQCLILFICTMICYGDDIQNQYIKRNYDNHTNDYQEMDYKFLESDDYQSYNEYDEEYVGNPDFDAIIERPCLVFDLNCIRKYFAKHSMCKIRRGPLPRNLLINQEEVYISRVNLTAALLNNVIGSFRNSRIEEFYINKRTNKMVFSIQIRGYTSIISSAYLRFFRRSREPVVVTTEAFVIYPSNTFTAVVPFKDEIQLDKAEITTFIDSTPAFGFGPEVFITDDITVTQGLAEVFQDVPGVLQELMLTESFFIPPAYIQYNICDFGLKVPFVDNN